MKIVKDISPSIMALPLVLSSFSALADHDVSRYEWTTLNKNQAMVLARDVADSQGLVVTCSRKSIVVDIGDLVAHRGSIVRYWTESNQGGFLTTSNGMVSSEGNDAQTVLNFITDLVKDDAITFMVDNKSVTYTLKGSANAIKSLKGCGLRNT